MLSTYFLMIQTVSRERIRQAQWQEINCQIYLMANLLVPIILGKYIFCEHI